MKRLPLFAHRPAPVVIGWFNMYATTGMDGFDYLIGDPVVAPPDEDHFYTEKLLRVSASYLTFDVNYPVPPVITRSGKVFGSLASQYKITDRVVEAWSRILHAAAGSSLLVKNKQMASPTTREFLTARFVRNGISADRLQLEGPEPHYNFLEAYQRIDIALDTFPYNGGTTTTEAIWQGVPVVTFYGDRWASRTSASILHAAGLSHLVAHDVDSYVELAIQLAKEPVRLTREALLASQVCDTRSFARQMESIYQRCIKLACDG
jgi:predicted O-linked N-acetylglucosamine transferase (SPINDLY family)